MNIAERLVSELVLLGADTCFSVNGGMAMYLNKALHDNTKIKNIYLHHEQAVISAAEGYAKASSFQKFGLACITSGPAVANSISGLLSANGDSTPLVVLAGQIKQSDIDIYNTRTHGIQEIPSFSIVSPCVKTFVRIAPERFNEQLIEIAHSLSEQRPGVIFIEVPLDVQSQESPNIFPAGNSASKESQTPVDKDVFLTLISESKKLGIHFGNGIRIANTDIKEILNLCERKGIPKFYTWLSFDLEPSSEDYNFGCPGSFANPSSNKVLQECDLVIFLGSRLDLATTAFQRETFGNSGKRILVDVDQAELNKFKDSKTYKVNYDLRQGLGWLCQIIEHHYSGDWNSESLTKLKLTDEQKSYQQIDSNNFTPYVLAKTVSKFAKNAVVIPSSSGYAEEVFSRFFEPNGDVRFFNGAALGSMGHGLAQGIGASYVEKTRPVWVFESDGGLWMSSRDLASISTLENQNFKLFIMNNHGYSSIRKSQDAHFKYHFGCDIESGLFIPDYKLVSEALGLPYKRISNLADFVTFFENIENDNSKIVELMIDDTGYFGPRLKTKMSTNGPITEKLEELSWQE